MIDILEDFGIKRAVRKWLLNPAQAGKWRRPALMLAGVILLLYVGLYWPRRAYGKYACVASGQLRLNGVSALPDLEQWSPEGCWWQPNWKSVTGEVTSRGEGWGYFYAPLIFMDRSLFFPDRALFDDKGHWIGGPAGQLDERETSKKSF